MKIPFLSSAAKNIKQMRKAIASGEKIKALHHGAAASADIAFPGLMGKMVYDVSKGFAKESSVVMEKLSAKVPPSLLKRVAKTVGKGALGVAKFPFKHPLATATGVGGIGAGVIGHSVAQEVAEPKRRVYGPQNIYRGEFR